MRNTKTKSSKRILTAIANYFIENIKAYTFIAIIFIIGIILAIVFINNLDESQRNEISTYITTFTNSLKDYMIDYVDEKIARGESQEKLGEEVYQIINDSYYDFVTDGQRMINMGAVAYSVKDMVESKALSMLISGDEKNEVIVIDDNLIDHIDMLDEDR